MRKTITRTITATTINSAIVSFLKGIPIATPNKPLTVTGTIDEIKAQKEIRKVYGASAQVTELVEVNDIYEISVEDFMKYAKKVINPTEEQKAETVETEKKDEVKEEKPSTK